MLSKACKLFIVEVFCFPLPFLKVILYNFDVSKACVVKHMAAMVL